jgi:hypothetical protein
MILYRLWISKVSVHALSNLLSLRTANHLNSLQVALNASLSRVFGVPTSSVRFLHMELGFPPLRYQCDIALARFHCHLALAPSQTLHSIMHQSRRLQPQNLNPDSLEQCTRSALIRLGRPLDYDYFVLPDNVPELKLLGPSAPTHDPFTLPHLPTGTLPFSPHRTSLVDTTPTQPSSKRTYAGFIYFSPPCGFGDTHSPRLPSPSSNFGPKLLSCQPIVIMFSRDPVTPVYPTVHSNIDPARTVRPSRATRPTCS